MTTHPAGPAGAASLLETLGPGQYLTGVHKDWHAIAPDALEFAATMSNQVLIVPAECGDLVRLAGKHGAYARDQVPVTYRPCPPCAWAVAVATGTVDREIALISPDEAESAALARLGLDPLMSAALCRAVLAAAGDPSDPEVLRQLAAITRHRPGLAVAEECAERSCGHQPCAYPDSRPVCWACSLLSGDEAGEWAGTLMEECTVPAPCGVLHALAVHYKLAAAISR